MLLLCLDASLARTGAALVRLGPGGAAVLAEREAEGGQGQAAQVALLAEAVLADAGTAARALDAVAATVGPGGFTGIRAALALARGLADGAAIPLLAVTTAEALAAPRIGAAPVAVIIDSRRGHRFVQLFRPGAGLPRADGTLATADTAGLAAIIPAGAVTVGDAPEATIQALPRARDLAAIAAARQAGQMPPLAAQPLYLDPPAARLATGLRPSPAA
ncbi:MAG: tRNA (adenosine(37)-N6)-threonylcarbamoyltransferase complex dimerization subunit type 1 TsaB [Acetobacteraceae bacterium]|jgi:tRNA threonylcarbamoyladenosine biosynthesis protein TsaB|nr:tRNA (adenosine(37)-N6)-threonylcarbamoyltransferase complex dimerization subunit type 1 TsaB [Acetobacteraceae bacterium]